MSIDIGIADRVLLLQESGDMPQHVAALGTFTLPDGAPADCLQQLVESLREARDFAMPFNQRLRNPALKAVAPSFAELTPDQVDLHHHFRHTALPRPGGERELGMLVSRLHSRPLDMSREASTTSGPSPSARATVARCSGCGTTRPELRPAS